MSAPAVAPLSVQLPHSIRRRVEELAQREGISAEQFVASAAGEKLAVWMSLDYLRDEAALGSPADLQRYLDAVPAREPIDSDRF